MSTTSVSLTNAVTSGDERAVGALIANGADVNESTNGGQTALILAVIFGHTNLVKLLVNSGADPQLRDNLGLNAIEWARRRGSREALEILITTQGSRASSKRVVKEPERPVVEPPPAQQPDVESRETVSDEEKSRRFLAGLRQRLDEQKLRQVLSPPEPVSPPAIETPAFERRAPETTRPSEPAQSIQVSSSPPVRGRILEPPPEVSPPAENRKRCPECNEIYNGDLVSYCPTHVVPLVDIDAPINAEPEPSKNNPPLFWTMVAITLIGSIVLGSLVTAYLFRSNQATARNAVQLPTTQKGFPEAGGDLVGKVVSLPEAECPLNGPEPLTGTVIVRVRVGKNGQVNWARGSGGDWLMRGASTEAAMKSTFAPEKLRGRETEGTITYTFRWPY